MAKDWRLWAGWGLLAALFAIVQFAKELWLWLAYRAYYALFWRPIGAPLEYLEKRIGWQVYHGEFWGKVLYSALVLVVMVASIWFFGRNRAERKLCYSLLTLAWGVTIAANVGSKLLQSHWLQTFSRDTLEVLTSPFPVIFMLPMLVLYRKTATGATKAAGTRGRS